MPDVTKKCPMCAEEIKAEAKICRFCKTEFDVTWSGYCRDCHKVAETDDAGRCPNCGGELVDLNLKSKAKEQASGPAAQQAPAPAAPPPIQPPLASPVIETSHTGVGFQATPQAAPVAAPPGPYMNAREGIGVKINQFMAFILMGVCALSLLASFFVTLAEVASVGTYHAGFGFPLVGILVAIVLSRMETGAPIGRAGLSRSRELNKQYRRDLRASGYFRVFKRKQWKLKVALLNTLFTFALLLWFLNYSRLSSKTGVTYKFGFYFTLIIPAVGLLLSLFMWTLVKSDKLVLGGPTVTIERV